MYHNIRKAKRNYNNYTYYSKYEEGDCYLDRYLSDEYNRLLQNVQDVMHILYTGTNDLTVVKCMKEMIKGKLDVLSSFACYLSAERCNEWSAMIQRLQESLDACVSSYIDYTHDFGEDDSE